MQRLIRIGISHADDVQNVAVRTAYGKRVSLIGIGLNILLFAGKIVVGTVAKSISITADAVNNLSDASSSLLSLLGFKMASKPADEEHPFGHGRYEYLSGLMVAVLIMAIGVELLKSSVTKIVTPSPVVFSWTSIAVLVVSMAIKAWMMRFTRQVGKWIDSQTLLATAADSRNDVIATAAVLVATLVSALWPVELDGWMGFAVAIFILISGFGLIRDTLSPMLGKAPDVEQVNHIRDKIMSYPGVLGTHDLMIHDYGPGEQFASVHVEMAAEDDVCQSHDVIDNIERDFLTDDGLHMVIHFDPIITKDPMANDLRTWLAQEVQIIHPELSIHDLRLVRGPSHTNVIFDCVMPHNLDMTDGELKAAVSALVKKAYPDSRCVITVDRSYAPLPR